MMNCKKRRYLGMILVMLLLVFSAIFYCPHKVTYTKVAKEANCFEPGQIDTICKRCDTILESNTLEKTAHTFGDFELTIKPSASSTGLEVRVCSICSKEEKRLYYCPHEVTYTEVVKVATCFAEGQIDTICEMCDTVLANNTLEKTAHTFGEYELTIKPTASEPGVEIRVCSTCSKEEKREYYCPHKADSEERWVYTKYATPFERGERYKHCYLCGAELRESYAIPTLKDNSIYITGTDIKHGFTISSFTQSAVDSYDIVYTEGSELGANNPFVLGHNYGTLGRLYQTKVGDYVYLNINGTIEIYKVVVSEYGVQNSAMDDIIGQTTGTSIWKQYDSKTLHMYTCYGNNRNGRWMVLAKKVF